MRVLGSWAEGFRWRKPHPFKGPLLPYIAPRFAAVPLRGEEHARDHADQEHRRGAEPSEVQPAGGGGLGEDVAKGRPQRSGKDEGCPEHQAARDVREAPDDRHEGECGAEHQRAAAVAEPGVVGQEGRRARFRACSRRGWSPSRRPPRAVGECRPPRRFPPFATRRGGRAGRAQRGAASHRHSRCPASGRRSRPWSCRRWSWRRSPSSRAAGASAARAPGPRPRPRRAR